MKISIDIFSLIGRSIKDLLLERDDSLLLLVLNIVFSKLRFHFPYRSNDYESNSIDDEVVTYPIEI